MTRLFLTIILLCGSLIGSATIVLAEEPHAHHQGITLSPALRDVLRAEMREITTGIQNIAVAMATADWKAIQDHSEKVRVSYVMEKKLTPEQAKELEHTLPERFKQLDAEFHQRAAKLGVAASAHDAELVTFHYSRLLESCVQCHTAYARSRFPGFAPVMQDHHH